MTWTTTAAVSRRRKQLLAGTALSTAAVLAFAGPVTSALGASDGQPVVQTSETVKADLKADGTVEVARLFSQIAATGSGTVRIADPTSTKNLRNLDGWGAPTTRGGTAIYDFSVDGEKRFRTVADFTRDLPVSVKVTYTLDGKQVDPGDLAGKSGRLEVAYDIKNTTAAPTRLTYQDGQGKTVTETADVVTPYIGQLQLDLPDTFANITTQDNRADQAGDGRGGRLLSWTMVLFEPIGQIEQKFGFSADVTDLALPKARVQILPVSPQTHPELKFGQDGFQSGAATGRELTDGATQIDDNVLKLRDGAAKLLDGLTQLQAGAAQLNNGLASGVPQAIDGGRQLAQGASDAAAGGEQVADGAKRVAAGNEKLAAGLGALAGGAGQLQTGARQLYAGAAKLSIGFQDPNSDADLIDGSQALAGALGLISGGLAQLNNASSGLPAAKAGATALRLGVNQILAGIGSPSTPNTILWGLDQLTTGNARLKDGVTQLQDGNTKMLQGITQVQNGTDQLASLTAGLPAAKTGVDQVKLGLDGALVRPSGSIDTLAGGVAAAYYYAGCGLPGTPIPSPPAPGTDPTNPYSNPCDYLEAVYFGIETSLREQTQAAAGGLGQVSAGLGSAITGLGDASTPNTIRWGLAQVAIGLTTSAGGFAQVTGGLDQSADGLAKVTAGVNQVRLGLKSGSAAQPGIYEGLAQLVAGLTTAVSGVGQLAPGAAAANAGAGDLAYGIAQAGDGAAQLASGAGQLSGGLDQVAAKVPDAVSGAQALAKGSAALADGSKELAAGLSGKLAPGANQLADGLAGLQAAVDGSGQIADGMTQAVDGNQQIVDGAGRLSTEGTSQLVKAGEQTTIDYGREYATMQALNEKGLSQGLPYGAPTVRFGAASALGASAGTAMTAAGPGSTDDRGAYDISIAGIGSSSGVGNTGRGLIGIVVLALGAAAALLIRARVG